MTNLVNDINYRNLFFKYYLSTIIIKRIEKNIFLLKKYKNLDTKEINYFKILLNNLKLKRNSLKIKDFNINLHRELNNVEINLDNELKNKGFYYLGGTNKSIFFKKDFLQVDSISKLKMLI